MCFRQPHWCCLSCPRQLSVSHAVIDPEMPVFFFLRKCCHKNSLSEETGSKSNSIAEGLLVFLFGSIRSFDDILFFVWFSNTVLRIRPFKRRLSGNRFGNPRVQRDQETLSRADRRAAKNSFRRAEIEASISRGPQFYIRNPKNHSIF